MTYTITINRLERGRKTLLKNINLTLAKNDRVALIGANGAGKTTLLSYLNKHHFANSSALLKQELDNAVTIQSLFFPDQTELGKLYSLIQKEAATLDDIQRYEELGGYLFEGRVLNYLEQYGFSLERKITSLSGGERKILSLKKIEFQEREILLLDEPTNHMDEQNREILKEFIHSYRGCILCISHDIDFIQECFRRTWVIENGEIEDYPMSVKDYFLQKERKRRNNELLKEDLRKKEDILKSSFEKKKIEATKQDSFKQPRSITKTGRVCKRDAGAGSAQFRAQSLHKGTKSIERSLEMIHEKKAQLSLAREPSYSLNLKSISKSKGRLISVERFCLKEKEGLLSFSLSSSEKVWLQAPNAWGKSSLLKIIEGEEIPYIGDVYSHKSMKVMSFKQFIEREELLYRKLDSYDKEKREEIHTLYCSWGGEFLSLKNREQLSSGQKVKLWMAMASISQYDLLLFDEPESHLDLFSRRMLESFMKNYQGAILLITHDTSIVDSSVFTKVVPS
ncbi:ATP-binding cassette domain-containing protein [Halobacteriovorax sp. GB3]|uniref:ATP-binding cassette domain-containing protein n=1 Tax=Halobacteriovorax sp. GB3 TaxID=2719615 RepID=UPI00235F2BAB|nr:ATP-binding cassette domain-containing protein [Halobacteriovorax sp. GB3]MDD0852086.1 ATP-binding cassette domain-containing protein [Halobacteriovorax sp. GB3]